MSRKRSPGEDAGYEVGYGKPPTENRFKKGESGNPAGRAKGKKAARKHESLVELLNRVAQREIKITVNDRSTTVTMLEAMMTKTFQQALAGKQDAVRTILSHIGQVDEWAKNRVFLPTSEEILKMDPREVSRAYRNWIQHGVPKE